MNEKISCPDCKVEMKEEMFSRSFGNPHTVIMNIPSLICPQCSFRVISEDEYEKLIQEPEKKEDTFKLIFL